MEGFIQANGGDIAKTVTNKCTHLISAETGTKKCQDAEKKGVIVVDEEWVRAQCGGDSVPEPEPKKVANKESKAPTKKAAKTAKAAPSSGALAGFTFCMTGTMSVSRAEMEKYIIANGGEIAKTVTKNCTHLISAQTGTKKCEDAEKKGAIVVNEEWVREQCGEGGDMVVEEEVEEEEEEEEPAPVVKKAAKATKPKAPKASAKKTEPAAEPVASSGNSETIHLECPSSSGGKFWECTLNGTGTSVTYGKVGAAGSTQVKDHGSEEAARKFFDKMVKEKTKKGYA
jgi:predicted DNA-binding WGR domain protein